MFRIFFFALAFLAGLALTGCKSSTAPHDNGTLCPVLSQTQEVTNGPTYVMVVRSWTYTGPNRNNLATMITYNTVTQPPCIRFDLSSYR